MSHVRGRPQKTSHVPWYGPSGTLDLVEESREKTLLWLTKLRHEAARVNAIVFGSMRMCMQDFDIINRDGEVMHPKKYLFSVTCFFF